jgi:hypothetical protein
MKKRFETEAAFNGITPELRDKYFQKTYNSCGMKHFWPVNYPMVESNHTLYTLVCTLKKKFGEKCRFSLECADDDAVCVRPLYLNVGVCFRTENDNFNMISQKVNDKMLEAGKFVKDKVKDSFKSIKKMFQIGWPKVLQFN